MSNLNSLLNVYHVGESFLQKVNRKRNQLNKGLEFSFHCTEKDLHKFLYKEINLRISYPYNLKYSREDTDVRWLHGYSSKNLGGRIVVFPFLNKEKIEKINIHFKIPEFSIDGFVPLLNTPEWYSKISVSLQLPENFLKSTKKTQVFVSLKAETEIPILESPYIDEELALYFFKHFVSQKTNLTWFHLKKYENIQDLFLFCKSYFLNYKNIIDTIEKFMITKDISLFLYS